MPYADLFTARGVTYRGADLGSAQDVEIRADGTLAAVDGSADLVVSFQVLEHVRDIDTYLREAKRVLRDDGLLLLSTHGTWLYHPHPEDHRRWTRQGLIAELELRGFDGHRLYCCCGAAGLDHHGPADLHCRGAAAAAVDRSPALPTQSRSS